MTTPPLLAVKINTAEAARARTLAAWLVTENFGDPVSIFDFYGRLADNGTNTLRKGY